MGWLFGRKKKKKKKLRSALHDDQSFSFGADTGSDTVIKPDQFKAAAGFDDSFSPTDDTGLSAPEAPEPATSLGELGPGMSDEASDVGSAWGQMSPPAMPLSSTGTPQMLGDDDISLPGSPRPTAGVRRLTQDHKYLQVHVYKRILGELHDLDREMSHMRDLGKSLDKAEYNEEKHFMRLKDTMRKAHDKTLQSDRILFSHSS